MNEERADHSSCTVGKSLYVVGGLIRGAYNHISNSIEKLDKINEIA